MDSRHSASSKTKKSGHSLTKNSFNISNDVQPGGRVILTSLHLKGSVSCPNNGGTGQVLTFCSFVTT